MKRRYIFLSDLHKCHIDWGGIPTEERHNRMVRQLNESCKDNMPDAIFILGDISLDFWQWEDKGCYLRYPPYSYAKRFVDEVVPRFPMKPYIIPGNHEQYTNHTWKYITGFDRTYNVRLGNDLFILLDNFSANLEPSYHSDGTYTRPDCGRIKKAMEENPGCNIFLCAHSFDYDAAGDEFKDFLKQNRSIPCMLQGHTHSSKIIGDEFCPILQTGNYSFGIDDTLWGWRELTVDDNEIRSFYHIPANSFVSDGKTVEWAEHDTDEWIHSLV